MQALMEAIRQHPGIAAAAITGSRARAGAGDGYSDWDILVIARDLEAVCDVRAWLPPELRILVCAFHLTNYCSILLNSFEKIDLAIFSVEEPVARWVVHDYQVLKGSAAFAAELAESAARTRSQRAAHLHPDVSLENILLLLATAAARVRRGERLSAHALLAMAADMVVSLEKRERGVGEAADLLDPRRRLERSHPELAKVMEECLFAPPEHGIGMLTAFVSVQFGKAMTGEHRQVIQKLMPGARGLASR